ncbi:ROK family protein [Ruminococcus gauvreauii]|uniref:ROK family protein n=1 Tax=Ruminococcus gauvreauii TaxID=438033 RepID=A0ABY5VLF3_9FIRM|nr:ROK family protein [Ruminococcus gauvreauii]UWP61031.1 ROK family protein [Ruminococcus gauvreauii]
MVTMRNDITKVKEINIELIKTALKNLGTATKAQIAEATDISVATCGKILNELCQSGEVLEAAVASGGYGRPAKSYVYNGNYAFIACIYAEMVKGRTKISTVVSNLLGELQGETTQEADDVTYETLEEQIEVLIREYPKLRAVAIGIPGYITDDVVDLCNFVSLMGVPLQSRLQEKFPGLRVLVENDMNAAAFGFYRSGSVEKNATLAFIYSPVEPVKRLEEKVNEQGNEKRNRLLNFGINFGAGFVSGGKILRGATGFAGEVAFLPMPPISRNKTAEVTVETMAYIIGSIVPILNPEIIALTGVFFNAENIEKIRDNCLKLISPQHMPQIMMRDDIRDDYINGLLNLALEELACSVALVERHI